MEDFHFRQNAKKKLQNSENSPTIDDQTPLLTANLSQCKESADCGPKQHRIDSFLSACVISVYVSPSKSPALVVVVVVVVYLPIFPTSGLIFDWSQNHNVA